MTTLSPVSVLTRVAIVAADRATFEWLAGLIAVGSKESYDCRWWSGRTDPVEAGDNHLPTVYLVDARERGGPGRTVWRELQDVGQAHAAVLLVDSLEQTTGDSEALPVEHVNARELERALRHARRAAVAATELRAVRAQLASRVAAQEELDAQRAREQRLLQSIMQSLPLLIGRVDARGRIVEAHGALARCDIEATQIVGHRLAQIFPQARQAVRQALESQPASFSLRGRHGGQEWHAEFVLMPESGLDSGTIFLGRDVSERRWLEQQLLTTADAEQKRIGADLHDGLGQQLTGLACLATALRDRLHESHDAALAAQADFIAQVANDATRQSRALARGLCPVQLEGATIESALSDLTYQAQQLHGIQCQFRSRCRTGPLDHFTAIHLYRITQEALHNAVRHGNARNVRVTLVSCGPRHRLTVMDDGCGFDSRQPVLAVSRGLRLMSYRAGMIGGTLSIHSRPGYGTRILCNFSHFSAPPHEDQR